jgi:hypothetical protein
MSDDGVVPANADADEVHLTDDEGDNPGAYVWVVWDVYGPLVRSGLALLISCSLSIVFLGSFSQQVPQRP